MGFGFGFRLNLRLRYSVPVQSPRSFTNSLFRLSSSPAGGREASFNCTRLSLLSTIYEEGETTRKNFGRAFAFSSSALETLDNDSLEREETKVNEQKRLPSSVREMIDDTQMPYGEEIATICTKFQSIKATHFRLLMENLAVLEETSADSEALRLEKDIIFQLEKLGVLELFNACLLRSLESSYVLDYTVGDAEQVGEHKKNYRVDDYVGKVVVQSSKKKENRTRRKRELSLDLKASQEDRLRFSDSSVKRASNTRNRRIMVARREAEMSKAVKVLAELEKIRIAPEEDTKQVASLRSWAKASGVDEKVLLQQLHYGRYCRDELIRSTRSLVLYLARRYRGSGIALEDLLQAGYEGVLQGAERFDSTRGYRFSTYVQYWIRKSMSRVVARYARGIIIPRSLSKALNQIQKARKAIKINSMKRPDDYEISKMTGLSLDKIRSASTCMRIVASINQKIGDCLDVEYMELMPDTSIGSPEEAVMKQHMRTDIHDLLEDLDSRERQVLTLRFGLNDHQPRSLAEAGRHVKYTKEWIRKIEKKALTKLRNEAVASKLNHYLYM